MPRLYDVVPALGKVLQMVCMTDALQGALINGGEALAGGPFLEGGAGVYECHHSRAPETRMSPLNAVQRGASCWFLEENH